jgi:hypothetical protein
MRLIPARCAKARATASGSRSITCRSANASDGIDANTEALGEFHLRQVHAFAREPYARGVR